MLRYRVCLLIVIVFFAQPIISVGAETWRIDEQQGLRKISKESDRYLLAVTRVKQLAISGETKKLTKAIEELKKAFTGYCSICGISENEHGRRLAMDHDHSDGGFRGFLCRECNVILGLAGEQPRRLERCASYIRTRGVTCLA